MLAAILGKTKPPDAALKQGPPSILWAVYVAGQASIDPEAFGPDTPMTGHGVLALTACGRRAGHRGVLPI